jgi:GxxExxY protein
VAEILHKELSFAVGGAAMEVHRHFGPGFLEAVYHKALECELSLCGIPYESHKCLRLTYKDAVVGEYEADMVVDDKIILELKSVSAINAAHVTQAHHYLVCTGLRLAIVLNFGQSSLQMKRIAR